MIKEVQVIYEKHVKAVLNIYSVGMMLMFVISLLLLIFGFLGGAEFVAFVVACAVLCIVIKMLPEISEFSLAGNTVKLKQKLDEAERLTEELRALKLSTLRTLLNLLLRHPGGFAPSYGDNRLSEFFNFFAEVKATEYENVFADELLRFSQMFKARLELQQTNYNTKYAGGEQLTNSDSEGIKVVQRDLLKLQEMIAHLEKTN